MKLLSRSVLCLMVLAATGAKAEVTYVHTDHLGSVVAESNASGIVTKRFHYKPYGDTIEAQQDDIAYTGHKHDVDLGLTYMQARYYDPVVGRFYGSDPESFNNPHNFNKYLYANGNPYNYVDPDGRNAIKKFIKQTIKHRGNVFEAAVDVADTAYTIVAPSSTPLDRVVAAIEMVSPVTVSDVKDAKNLITAVRKRFGGRKGNADTRAHNQAIGDRIDANGGSADQGGFNRNPETHFPSDGPGNAGGRYSDGSALDADTSPFEVQTIDVDSKGVPTPGEMDAARDIADRSGHPVILVPKVRVDDEILY